jgi:hypothetical protein
MPIVRDLLLETMNGLGSSLTKARLLRLVTFRRSKRANEARAGTVIDQIMAW